MKIQDKLIEPYEIWEDGTSYTMGIPTTVKLKNGETKEVLKGAKYYTTLESALRKIMRYKIANMEQVLSIQGYIRQYGQLWDRIEQSIKI